MNGQDHMNIREVLPRDAIVSIDDPTFGHEYFGSPEDEVIVVEGNPARAYPIRILSYHEIVNDTIEDQQLAVTWCPICWSAVVFNRTVDHRTLAFGVSGKLADDALVMYDRETGSEWKQPTGTAISGELHGTKLEIVPFYIVPWDRFNQDDPDGLVLQPVRGGKTNSSTRGLYDMRPYERYSEKDAFGLYGMRGTGPPRSWNRTDLEPKAIVFGIEEKDDARGYPLHLIVSNGGIVRDTIGATPIVVTATDTNIQAFMDSGYSFKGEGGDISADGAKWDPITGTSDDGRTLTRVTVRRMFAFTWQDIHGPDAFYLEE